MKWACLIYGHDFQKRSKYTRICDKCGAFCWEDEIGEYILKRYFFEYLTMGLVILGIALLVRFG